MGHKKGPSMGGAFAGLDGFIGCVCCVPAGHSAGNCWSYTYSIFSIHSNGCMGSIARRGPVLPFCLDYGPSRSIWLPMAGLEVQRAVRQLAHSVGGFMSVYFVEGHLGGGKSVQCVGRLITYAEQGRRIAGNIDINLEKLCPDQRSKQSYIRLPDIPTGDDLYNLGLGSDSRAEDTFGALVLDECAMFLNARDWNAKGRSSLVGWLVHARKRRWDVFIIIQSIDALDSQIRKLLHEYTVDCLRLDKLTIPFVTRLTGLRPPKLFVGRVFYGRMSPPVRADSWYMTGKRAFECYDTEQEILENDGAGPYCLLSNWHRVGRFLPPPLTKLQRFHNAASLCVAMCARCFMVPVVLFGLHRVAKSQPCGFTSPSHVPGSLPLNLSPFNRSRLAHARRAAFFVADKKNRPLRTISLST